MTAVVDQTHLHPDRRPLLRRLALASEPWLYSSPALILIIAVMLVPLALGISYAFRDVRLLNPFSGGFVGLQHFEALATDKNFARALKNTLWWAGASVFFQFTLGLILALLLDRPFRGRAIAQALVFLPWAVPSFLSGLNWAWLFNPVVGPLPHWFFALGLFVTSMLLYSQAATTQSLVPLGLSLGIAPAALAGMFPAVNGYFFIPTYGTLIAAVVAMIIGARRAISSVASVARRTKRTK